MEDSSVSGQGEYGCELYYTIAIMDQGVGEACILIVLMFCNVRAWNYESLQKVFHFFAIIMAFP